MKTLLLLLASMTLALTAQAQTIFTFGNTTTGGQATLDLDDKLSGSTVSGGITLSAFADSGTFNSTTSAGFGINNTGTDNTTEFDLTNVMSFSFDQAVTLTSIDFNAFTTTTDVGYLTYSGGTISLTADPTVFVGVNIAANEVVQLGVTSGSFSLQSITVDAVPEPSVYMLLGVGLLFCGQRFIRRKSA